MDHSRHVAVADAELGQDALNAGITDGAIPAHDALVRGTGQAEKLGVGDFRPPTTMLEKDGGKLGVCGNPSRCLAALGSSG